MIQTLRLVFITTVLAISLAPPAAAQEPEEAPEEAPKKARVLPLGVFHFKDAGLDVAQVDDFDVMSDAAQRDLELLTDQLAAFRPTAVLLEYNPSNDAEINEKYHLYLDDDFELTANEIYQLGFRIAAKAGLKRVHSWDHREVQWQAAPLFEYGEANDSPELKQVRSLISEFEQEETRARNEMDLLELLNRHNDPEKERLNRDLYLMTNPVGVGDSWVGADATASWWHRNFRMYAIIQQHAGPGARVIVIGGSGHMAIIKQLLQTDRRIEREQPGPYLQR